MPPETVATSPATVTTPAAPAPTSTPGAPTRPKQQPPPSPQALRGSANTVQRTYDTGGKPQRTAVQAAADAARGGAAPAASAVVAPVTPVQATPAAVPTAAPAAVPPVATEPEIVLPAAVTDAGPAETPAPEVAPAETEAKVTDADVATRLGKLERRERRFAEEKQAFAQEKQQHAESLRKVQIIEQASTAAKQDPLGFLHRAFGITPQQVVDHIIGQQQRQGAHGETPSAAEQRIAALEQQLQDSAKQEKQRQSQQQVSEYISGTIRPIVADRAKYPFLNHEFGGEAETQVYNSMKATWDKHRVSVDPNKAAATIEKYLKDKYERAPGAKPAAGSAASGPTATQRQQVGAPTATQRQAPAQGAQPQGEAPAPATSEFRRPRVVTRPYTSQAK